MNIKKSAYIILACVLLLASSVFFLLGSGRISSIEPQSYLQSVTSEQGEYEPFRAMSDQSKGIPGMTLAATNDALSLYIDPKTTVIAVKDDKSGDIWYSNPEERAEDSIATAFEKDVMSSQLSISFRNTLGVQDTYTNHKLSIEKEQFELFSIQDGVRIEYTIGDTELGIDALPKLISKQRLQEKVLDKLSPATAKYVETRYLVSDASPEILERADAQVGRPLVLRKMMAAFEEAGYTAEDLAADNEENGIAASGGQGKAKFKIPLEYRLEGETLTATVPLSQVEESEGQRIQSIDLLAYFGAAKAGEEGYMLVPDGTGSLIYLDNGKTKEEQYVQPLYGADTNDNSRSRGQVAEKARMPVYGLVSGDRAFFAVIEKGDGNASVAADISGKQNSYNHVYSRFIVRGEDELELYTGSKIQEIQLLSDDKYTGDVQVKYAFLSGDEANYSGMARTYQEMLVKAGKLTQTTEEGDLPFYVDVLGSVDMRESFLGVPYNATVPMTTFEEAKQITEALQKEGISSIQMRYLGWFGEGIEHELPVRLQSSGLGSTKELRSLNDLLQKNGGGLYPDVAFLHVYHKGNGFSTSRDASRFITKEEALLSPYDRALNRMSTRLDSYYLLSPSKVPDVVSKFMEEYESKEITGLSLRDLGDSLHSDYRNKRIIFKETARQISEEQTALLAAEYPNLMISGGNIYALGSAKHIINTPAGSSGFQLTDESVPFYQMVIHGYKDYTGEPMNLAADTDVKSQLLQSLEQGKAPHFLWSSEPASELKFTRHDKMYSTDYEAWIDEATKMYQEVSEILAPLRTVHIDERVVHQPGVIEMQYSNGTHIWINYNDKPVVIGKVSIPAQHYFVGGDES
ncbi:DUF5696 domain-containing protein [Paenibacillus sp. GYB006]|uniref:DUF5696 domain-containing protein n=1 Tax=Paenibacillus sp. GYB006 TaxID=2994394 RepID=UPI002F96BF3F